MKTEIFKDIIGYEGIYQVSNKGRVKSLLRKVKNGNSQRIVKERILKVRKGYRGYYMVGLKKDNIDKKYEIHQLMAITFLNHKPNGQTLVVDHIDDNKLNNNLNNLRIISHRQNISKSKIGSSKYTGVYWNKKHGKWMSRILINNKREFLGLFINEKEASMAYQNKLLKAR